MDVPRETSPLISHFSHSPPYLRCLRIGCFARPTSKRQATHHLGRGTGGVDPVAGRVGGITMGSQGAFAWGERQFPPGLALGDHFFWFKLFRVSPGLYQTCVCCSIYRVCITVPQGALFSCRATMTVVIIILNVRDDFSCFRNSKPLGSPCQTY